MALMTFPDRQTVLDFLRENPSATTKQEIARGLKLKGKERTILREILKEMEGDGTLERTGKRAWAQADRPPPTASSGTHTAKVTAPNPAASVPVSSALEAWVAPGPRASCARAPSSWSDTISQRT